MRINIKKIKYDSISGPVEYITDKKINIIKGVSGTGKSPFMFLLFYTLGNSNAKEFYINHRKSKDISWTNETLECFFEMEHNGISKNIYSKAHYNYKKNKILLTVIDESTDTIICTDNFHSSIYSDWMIKTFKLPLKIIWSTTVTSRHIKDFSPFYSMAPNRPGNEGYLYDISKPYRANKNTFISAYAILNNDSNLNKILKNADQWGTIEKSIARKHVINEYINALYPQANEGKYKTIEGKEEGIFSELEDLHTQIIKLKGEKSKYNAIIKNVSEESRLRRFIEKFNQEELVKQIDINYFMQVVFGNSAQVNLQLPTIKRRMEDINKNIKEFEIKIEKLSANMKENSIFSDENIKGYLINSLNNHVENIETDIRSIKNDIDNDSLENFRNVISKWDKEFFKLGKSYQNKILEFVGDKAKIEFKENVKIKYSSGGIYAQDYLYTFLGLNVHVNSLGNELPMLIDALFDGKVEVGNLNKLLTKKEVLDDFIKNTKSQLIITINEKDYKEIGILNDDDIKIYDSPKAKALKTITQ